MAMNYNEFRKKLKTCFVHLLMTPVKGDDEVDFDTLKDLINKQIEMFEGHDVIFLAGGSTAEFYGMNTETFKKYIDVVVDTVAGRVPVLMGTSAAGTKATIELSQYADNKGVDGIMLVAGYYHPAYEDGLYDHFKAIADSVKCGIVLYNNPCTSKLYIYPEMLKKLSKIKNIVGDKDNTNSAPMFYRQLKTVDPEDMTVFTGLGEPMFQYTTLLGCRSFVSDLANYLPKQCMAIHEAAAKGDYDRVTQIVDSIDDLEQFKNRVASKHSIPTVMSSYILGGGVPAYQSFIKEAMKIAGLPIGKVMAPMYNLNEEEVEELKGLMAKHM